MDDNIVFLDSEVIEDDINAPMGKIGRAHV